MKRTLCAMLAAALLLFAGCTPSDDLASASLRDTTPTGTESSTVPEATVTQPSDTESSSFPEDTVIVPQETETDAETEPSTVPEPPDTESSEPTEPAAAPTAEQLLSKMSLEARVGQLFIARCPEKNAVEAIQKYHLGGFVLFGRDFKDETPDSVSKAIASYQSASEIPMLIAVDEEGGSVNRVSKYPAFRESPFSAPRLLYRLGGLFLIEQTEIEKCQLLGSLGINVNLSPVCDITTDPDAFMYNRSLGQSPEITGEFVKTVVGIMESNHIGSVLKHFPGYGNNTDTHTGIAVDNRSVSELESVDLVPFAAGIKAGCDAILVSHVYINAIDPDTPATLSPAVHTYLRETMGFEGVIVTDDLAMEAITDVYGVGESAVLAVLAGNDLLCVTDYAKQYAAVLQAVKDGRISEEMVNQAVLRVLRWKMELGLL